MATGLINEVALLTKSNHWNSMEDTSGPAHYNKVALLMRWPPIEVSLYFKLVDYTRVQLLMFDII